MPRVLYLAYGGAEATVFDSQVLLPLKHLKSQGMDMHLTLFQNWKEFFFHRTRLERKALKVFEATGRHPILFPRIPRNFGAINTRRLRHTLEYLQDSQPEPLIIHARGMQSAALALEAKGGDPKIKVILDHRGLEAEEYLYIVEKEKGRKPNGCDQSWFKKLLELEKAAVTGSDRVFCVSSALKNEMVSRYGAAEKISVIPGGVDMELFKCDAQERRAMRKHLGLEHHLVLAYAGTLRAWQEASILPKILAAAKQASQTSFLLVLTPHKEAAIQALAGTPQSDYCVLNLPHGEIPKFLQASDIGILTRESHIVNLVASPTKGPEYLASGNLVLTTPHPQDLAEIIQKEGVGAVVPSVDDAVALQSAIKSLKDKIEKEGDAARQKARQTAETYYSWTKHLPKILATYQELA